MIAIVRPETLNTHREIGSGTDRQKEAVNEILALVKTEGDQALFRLTERFDRARLNTLKVEKEEFEAAFAEVDDTFVQALKEAAERIRRYHEKQKRNSWMETEADGTILGQIIRPLERVGVYVPGGRAAYPSSVLMNIIPARVAGVEEIVMVTPPQSDGTVPPPTLVAASIAGAGRVYKVGGAQAVAALAYGTESIPAVDKIVGPGNIYVTLAKQAVYGKVDIDSIAGPSEIVVVADETANPRFVAADMLSQAEHDPLASAVLITPSAGLADQVAKELEQQCNQLERKEIAAASLKEHGSICITKDLPEAFEVVNRLAPEHLELLVADPWNWLGKVKHAGAVFLGPYSPEPVGDYFAGPNHVLPTNGTARFFSPLNVDHFMKKTSVLSYSREALFRDGAKVMELARAEGLGAHAASIRVRLERKEEGEELV
ncbi:histidinol dehydrogenase [Paenactinomyces guangxiensis]|uniref:Histidinol dehydrogenase n=1 Tax=Paenactinomyces guangxiensis TaxID=1490290 RepID=A0A7W2AAF6_9BACL|nr:histidinol dehydrogenase [Paenactinomyces guangxiensis]MBA4496217.1 histidinol dehydrogenase [Paenactinomyces guangxiensis]MBH8593306.1 histidinol dehydrogenase [Paenactinomyces guangxiensis]